MPVANHIMAEGGAAQLILNVYKDGQSGGIHRRSSF